MSLSSKVWSLESNYWGSNLSCTTHNLGDLRPLKQSGSFEFLVVSVGLLRGLNERALMKYFVQCEEQSTCEINVTYYWYFLLCIIKVGTRNVPLGYRWTQIMVR